MKLFARNGTRLVANDPSDTTQRYLLRVDGDSESCCCPKYVLAVLWNCCCGPYRPGTNCADSILILADLLSKYENGNYVNGPYFINGRCFRLVLTTEETYPVPPNVKTYFSAGEGLVDGECSQTNSGDGPCPRCSDPQGCCNYVNAFPCNKDGIDDVGDCCVFGSVYRLSNVFQEDIVEIGINPEDIQSRSDGTLAAPPAEELYRYSRRIIWRKGFAGTGIGCPTADTSQDFYLYQFTKRTLLYDLEWTVQDPDGTIPPGSQLVRVNTRYEQESDYLEIPGGIAIPPIDDVLYPSYLRYQDPPNQTFYPPNLSFSGPGSACSGSYVHNLYSIRGALAFTSTETMTGTMAGCGSNTYSNQRYEQESSQFFFADRHGTEFRKDRTYVRLWSSSRNVTDTEGCPDTVCPERPYMPPMNLGEPIMKTSGGCGKCRESAGL